MSDVLAVWSLEHFLPDERYRLVEGLEVSGGGQGVVSHAGLALLGHLADKTGLTGGLARALATARLLVHDRGRVLADLACAIADGARVISDFRVMGDQGDGGRGLAFAFMIMDSFGRYPVETIHDHETWAPGAGSGSGTP